MALLSNIVHPDRWLLWLGTRFIVSGYCSPQSIVGCLHDRGKRG